MKCRVELVYDVGCPNVGVARAALLQVFARVGIPASWVKWDRKSPESPVHIRGYGSPTILVNGKDVADAEPGNGEDYCRLYPDGANDFRGIPAVDHIVVALTTGNHAAVTTMVPFGWRRLLAVVPGVGASLLPVASCPTCWLISTGILTSVGLGFLAEETSVLPMTGALLGVALTSLGCQATLRRGYGPLSVGVMAASFILTGMFWLPSNALLFLGVALLIGAPFSNAWPHKAAKTGCCATCTPQEPVVQPLSAHTKVRR